MNEYHSGAIGVGQIYFDHHSDTNGTFECGKLLVEAADKAIRKAMSEWQPIETAPKDGTPILVCYAPHYVTNCFLPVAVRWRCFHPYAAGIGAFRQSNGNKVEWLTHWMPLPDAPHD